MTQHVVMFSGGIGSWFAARRVAETVDPANMTLLFADTLIEDEDLYRFLDEAAASVGAELVRVAEGRTPWQVFRDVRYLGNSRIDPCSRVLKRDLLRKWLEDNHDPAETVVYIGIDWTEIHRYEGARSRWEPWDCRAPLCEAPYSTKHEMFDVLRSEGIEPPRLYAMGFPHNNCGGFCIKAGHAHFANLLRTMPARYDENEREEQALRDYLGARDPISGLLTPRNVSVMKDRRGGKSRPLTMKTFRERIQSDPQDEIFDQQEWGGCGCFVE